VTHRFELGAEGPVVERETGDVLNDTQPFSRTVEVRIYDAQGGIVITGHRSLLQVHRQLPVPRRFDALTDLGGDVHSHLGKFLLGEAADVARVGVE
jgi:hypothetical protein